MQAHYFNRRYMPAIMLALLPFGLWAQSLHTGPGIHLVVTGAPSIILQDAALINDGRLSPGNSNIVFTGNAPAKTAFIGGSRTAAFYRLTLSKTQGSLLLDNNITVDGLLSMDKGNLELNNHSIDLGSTGSIAGERNESRITGANGGTIKVTALLDAPQAVNPGNIGVEITSAAYMGATTIIRGHVAQDNAAGETGIQRYFDIAPAANAGLHASLRFYYFDNELAGNDKTALSLFAAKNGQHDWTAAGRDNANAPAGWVTKNDIGPLGRFTLAIDKGTPAAAGLKAAAFAWPNPSRNGFTLFVSATAEKDLVIGMYDLQGRLLETKTLHCAVGSNQVQWNTSKLAASTYYLRFSDPAIKNIAVVKQ